MAAIFSWRHFKIIFLHEICCILLKISLKFVSKGSIYNYPALFPAYSSDNGLARKETTSHYWLFTKRWHNTAPPRWVLTHWSRHKMATISQTRNLKRNFLECFNFHWYFTEIYSQGSNWQYISIGWDNGLAPNRRQAIIWTNGGMYASLGISKLSHTVSIHYMHLLDMYNILYNNSSTAFSISG